MTRVTIFGGHRDGEEYNVPDPLPQEYMEPGMLPPAAFLTAEETPLAEFPVIRYRLEWMARIYVDDEGNETDRRKWPVYVHPDINVKALNG
jgi:hypothetical protein